MLEHSLTEGALRSLEAVTILAVREGAAEGEPVHLLWALALGESQASETLEQAGLSYDRLQEIAPLAAVRHGIDDLLSQKPPGPRLPESEELRRVIAHATRTAALRGRHAQIGTDDLLAALAAVESPVSQILSTLGLCPETLSGSAGSVTSEPLPLDVDFHLRWRDATEAHRTETLRIVDAAANRAREGLRVLEDYTRFALDDAHLTRRLKQCRHNLREALSRLPAAGLLRSRDTEADVGTSIATHAETVRTSPSDVARAACKRVQEAVRSLEEFGKLWSAAAASELERLRYEMYTLEKAIFLTDLNRRNLASRRLYFLLTESLCHHGAGPAVRGALAGGAGIVQLREKELPDRRLIDYGRQVREWTREAGALYIMNDRADLAVVTEADGVHVGQDELSVKEARAIVGPDRLIGVSTHTIEQARQAVLDGADYLGVGPIFPSATKTFDSLAGLDFVRQVAAEITLPWFAIGGISPENLDGVLEAGAQRIAVSHAISSAENPRAVASALFERLIAQDSVGPNSQQ